MGVGVERIDPVRVAEESVEALALNAAEVGLTSPEALAASIRRAASFLCPTTPGALLRAVKEVLSGLPGFSDETEIEIAALVDSLVSYGDLIELPIDDGSRSRRQLFLGPPAFIPRQANTALLLGVRPEGAPLLSDDLLNTINHVGHARLIRSRDGHPIADLLGTEGLIELQPEQWMRAPRRATPEETVGFYVGRLEAAGPSGDIEGVRVIDPASKVTYYRGRWRILRPRDEGRFVARRPQAFGADLWCFTDVAEGGVRKLIDLPLRDPLAPGSDEAWHLQAALDALAGHPQRLRVRVGTPTQAIDFFSPVPSWIQRRLDVMGSPAPRTSGALFSYAFPNDEVAEEIRYLKDMMWLSVEEASGGIDDGS